MVFNPLEVGDIATIETFDISPSPEVVEVILMADLG